MKIPNLSNSAYDQFGPAIPPVRRRRAKPDSQAPDTVDLSTQAQAGESDAEPEGRTYTAAS